MIRPATISTLFCNTTATPELYPLSLHDRSSDLPADRGLRAATADVDHERGRVAVAGGGRAEEGESSLLVAADSARLDAERSEEHTSELQSRQYLVCRLLLEKKDKH